MITEQDLREAIAECEGSPKPTANTCIKLAAFYTIFNQLYGKEEIVQPLREVSSISREISPISHDVTISYKSDTEFSSKIDGKNLEDVLPVIDELMETLMLINPKLYDSVMQRL